MSNVIPGILEKDFSEIERKLEIIKPFSRWVHIDFLDGKFSLEKNFMEFSSFAKYKNDFYLEAHLMVDDPTQYLKVLSENGFRRFFGHIEKMKDINEFVAEGQILGEVGLAIDYQTQIETINVPFDDLDSILIMGIHAGKSGQVFLPETLGKIKYLKSKTEIPIEIDGGINEETLLECRDAGASRFVATSFIFQSQDPMQSYEKLTSLSG